MVDVDVKMVDASGSDSTRILSDKSDVDIFSKNKMSFDICILMYHAMMNCDNHIISRQGDSFYVHFCLLKSASCDSLALVESFEKGALTYRSQMVTSCQMFELLAWSRKVFFPFV